MNNLISNYEGVEQMRINYDFAGTANDLVVLDGEGKIMYNADGSVKTESALYIIFRLPSTPFRLS